MHDNKNSKLCCRFDKRAMESTLVCYVFHKTQPQVVFGFPQLFLGILYKNFDGESDSFWQI